MGVQQRSGVSRPWWMWAGALLAGAQLSFLAWRLFTKDASDFTRFYMNGRFFLQGVDIYTPILHPYYIANRYGPIHAVLMAPLALLPLRAALALSLAAHVGLMLFCLNAAWALLADDEDQPHRTRVLWLTGLLSFSTLASDFGHGQHNVLILALTLGTLRLVRQGREWLAGVPIALAIAIKLFVAPLALFLVYKRAWRAGVSTLLATLFFTGVVPVAVWGPARALALLREWRHTIGSPTVVGLDWSCRGLPNILYRLLVPCNIATEGESVRMNLLRLSPEAARAVICMAAGLMALCLLAACRRSLAETPWRRFSWELSLATTAMLLFSPATESFHMVLLMLPQMLLALHVARHPQDRRTLFLLAGSFLFLSVLGSDLVPKSLNTALRAVYWKDALGMLLLFAAQVAMVRANRAVKPQGWSHAGQQGAG